MEHIKSINEFFSFSKAKEEFQRGQDLAKNCLKDNPEVLSQIQSNIENLDTEKKSILSKVFNKLKSLTEKPEEVENIIGESILLEDLSGFFKILEKIGKWLGIGTLLATIFGGAGTTLYALAQGETSMAILGLIVFFIGIGLSRINFLGD
jgi:hypothetical protein